MNKKGFTLIELLAVIVILGLIALITTPILLDIMKGMRKDSFKNSTKGIVESAKIYYSSQTKEYDFSGKTFEFGIKNDEKELNYDGKNPKAGQVVISEEGKIEIYVTDGEFCAYKPFESNEITITDVTEAGCGKEKEVPEMSVAANKTTSNTVAIVANCSLSEDSKIKVARYEFSKDGGATWNYKLENEKYLSYYTYSNLEQKNENYSFKSRCITNVGTVKEVDVIVPDRTITKPIIEIPSGYGQSKKVTINYPKGRYKYQLSEDGGSTWIDIDTTSGNEYNQYTKTYTENITIIARVLDEADNYINSDNGLITGIDKEAPTCGTWAGGGSSWTNATRTITLTCTDKGGSGCTSSKYTVKSYSSGTTKTASLSYTIKDNANNTTTCTSTQNIYVDKQGPSKPTIGLVYGSGGVSSGTYSSGSWTKYDVLTEARSSDTGIGIAYYQYSHDGVSGWSNDITKLGWSAAMYDSNKLLHYWITWSGQWNFYVRAVDSLGNVSAASNVFTLRIDKDGPTTPTISNPTNGNWTRSDFSLTVSSTDALNSIAYYQYSYDNANWTTYASSAATTFTTTPFSTERNQLAYIRACDTLGNCSASNSTYIRIDKTPPSITIEPGDGTYYKGFIASVSCHDSGSGMPANGTFFHDWGTDAGSNTYGQYYTEQKLASTGQRCPTCSYTAYGTCTDNVGNSVTVHRSWNVVTSGTSGGTTAPTPGCSCEGGCVCKSTNSSGNVIYSCPAHEACARACGISPSTTCGA